MKTLITGAGGRLGPDLLAAFGRDEVTGLSSAADLDVTHEADVVAAVRDHAPDLVVHAAALTAADACEADPDLAWRVNAAGAWWVARACGLADARMVYLSTAEVFDGRSTRPYTEFDPVSPQSVYARTKEAGEQLVRGALPAHYIVRTSWLQGAHRDTFVKTVLGSGVDRRATGADPAADGSVRAPTFTFDLAPAIRTLAVSGRYGTYHLTNAGRCTAAELADAIASGAGGGEAATSGGAAGGGDAVAAGPGHHLLDNRMAALAGLPPLPHWRASLAVLLDRLAG